jgi:hypothetical protein
MIIKKFKQWLNEAISGTYDIAPFGPGFPRQELKVTSGFPNQIIFIEKTGEFYTKDDYDQLYLDYLKIGGKPLDNEFNKENLETVIFYKD